MAVNVAAELSDPNLAYTHHYYHKFVSVDDNKIIFEYISAWGIAAAAWVAKEWGIQSVIIDGVPFGPTPTSRASWEFATSRPYVIVEEWSDKHGKDPWPSNARWQKVDVRMKIGLKVVDSLKDGKRANWRAYPEIDNEQRNQLTAAIKEARAGSPAVRRESTVTFPDGYPRSL